MSQTLDNLYFVLLDDAKCFDKVLVNTPYKMYVEVLQENGWSRLKKRLGYTHYYTQVL
jgi:hypothetical protein